MHTPELVLLGGPNSGKTHYAGQLYGRVQRRPGQLRLRHDQGTPPDLRALEDVLRCLEDGHAAPHTSADTWAEVALPLVDQQGNAMDLCWPDYGGEQLRAVFTNREVSEAWQSRLVNADGWLLLIRLSSEITYHDALDKLGGASKDRPRDAARAGSWDANAYWVELMQLLLHVAGLGQVSRLEQPRLAVLLSCYDEREPTDAPPRDVLAQTLPLLSSFLDSTWSSESLSIWGLSALGRLLESDSEDEHFIDDGPEQQGWVIRPDGGAKDPDLSGPLAWLVGTR